MAFFQFIYGTLQRFTFILVCFTQKAPFLEEWFKGLCSSLWETGSQSEAGSSIGDQKKHMISKAIQSLIEVYESRNHQLVAQKFEELSNSIQL
jgi:predicted component of type VI protein secretion system